MKWINHCNGPQKDKINILCFPYAGAGSGYFARWMSYFDQRFQIIPIQYPMREKRMGEPVPDTIQELARQLVEESKELFQYPYVLLGHCMGSHIAYEVGHMAEEMYGRQALAVFLSSAVSPRNAQMKDTRAMSEEEFLTHYGVKEIIEQWDENYRKFFLPILRADSLMCEGYKAGEVKKLSAKICLLYGLEDTALKPYEKLLDWKNYTNQGLEQLIYTGDHFFIDRESFKVVEDITAYLERMVKEI